MSEEGLDERIQKLLCGSDSVYAGLFVKNIDRDRYARRYLQVKKLDWSLTPLTAGALALDVGCGMMIDSVWLALHGVETVALDKERDLVESGIKIAEKEGVRGLVHPVVGDALNLPFKEGVFDLAVSYSSIEHVPGRENHRQWISEMSKSVRDGGDVVLTTTNRLNLLVSSIAFLASRISTRYFETSFTPSFIKKVFHENSIELKVSGANTFFYYGYLGFTRLGYLIDSLIGVLEKIPAASILGGRMGFRGSKTPH